MARLEESKISGPGDGKVMYIPPMEHWGTRFFAAVFRSIGYDARGLTEDASTLALGLKNTGGGECVPCPSTTGSLLAAMERDQVDPKRVIFFMPTACGPCRFGQYAKLDRMIFERKGWDGIQIMSPSAENAYEGIDIGARLKLYHAMVVSDIMRKLTHRTRPYEMDKGSVDFTVENYTKDMEAAFSNGDLDEVGRLVEAVSRELAVLPKYRAPRPLIGVVGEIYVRSDPFLNNDVCRRIEELGGEAWLAPMGEWLFYTSHLQTLLAKEQRPGLGGLFRRFRTWLETKFFFNRVEHHYYELAADVLHDRHEHPIQDVIAEGEKFLPWQFEGEAVLTLGRAALFVKRDGAKAIVNASPMFCMPGTVTTSIFPALEKELKAPIICNFYDGSGNPNQSLVPVMHYLSEPYRAEQAREKREYESHTSRRMTRKLNKRVLASGGDS
ncbi:MAG: hypothetical protein LBJ46_11930 [Planctomycetota bacterium]|jgi:predicted nucleotide-binding protein (sugar kinase/HSP70/actin superfamily)|nr:hypothetical protein [Planctomycetota bacterium]